ncbi:MAG: S-layer homology domain-containing protein, partial [Clostridia bacterium]|nr:S-layer homology domain-containing protein [Clostridia bacterium]
ILGHGTIGDMSDIFIPHFADADQVPEGLMGYVELARSLGLIKGSTDNCFKPKEYLTNGDSLIIIYNYLINQG